MLKITVSQLCKDTDTFFWVKESRNWNSITWNPLRSPIAPSSSSSGPQTPSSEKGLRNLGHYHWPASASDLFLKSSNPVRARVSPENIQTILRDEEIFLLFKDGGGATMLLFCLFSIGVFKPPLFKKRSKSQPLCQRPIKLLMLCTN